MQDLIAEPLMKKPFFDCEKTIFHSAGREDVDVRMLGNGRPFVLEMIDAKRAMFTPELYQGMEDAVNNSTTSVSIHQVKKCDKVLYKYRYL